MTLRDDDELFTEAHSLGVSRPASRSPGKWFSDALFGEKDFLAYVLLYLRRGGDLRRDAGEPILRRRVSMSLESTSPASRRG